MDKATGLLLVIVGCCLIVFGLLVYTGALTWFGRLPGDFRYEGENTRIYFPLASMLLISIVLTLLFYVVRRFL
jgi:hypothetical protein